MFHVGCWFVNLFRCEFAESQWIIFWSRRQKPFCKGSWLDGETPKSKVTKGGKLFLFAASPRLVLRNHNHFFLCFFPEQKFEKFWQNACHALLQIDLNSPNLRKFCNFDEDNNKMKIGEVSNKFFSLSQGSAQKFKKIKTFEGFYCVLRGLQLHADLVG